ncbi:SpoIIE family protein phosphatase [Streptomyces sp. B1866]|uniref:SpoIIE family protein phosphatase n=1 Tax=Streptomyces sp. B1866 TaxID=3075431 RepID=UPI00288F7053|nr:SpoIIE family protein phosphatase [Streptomyces sp. B1866]MDT3396168.1 SpoIIE family protein phosphatase [Streptomyces sp. B1866]
MATREGNDLRGLRAVSGVADAASLLLDARGRVTGWSADAERLLGYPAERIVGRPATALLAAGGDGRKPDVARRCGADGGWSGVLCARHQDGRELPLSVRVVALADAAGPDRWLVLAVAAAGAPGPGMSRDVLERMVVNTPVGMGVMDTGLRFVWTNPALERYGGGTSEERYGKRFAECQPGLAPDLVEGQMRRALETGRPVVDFEYVGRPRSDPTRDRAFTTSFIRLEDSGGRPFGIGYTVVDVTDRYRSRQRLALLDRASEYIGRTLDVLQTAQDLADVAVPELADFVAVDLLEQVVGGGEPPAGPLGDAGLVRLLRGGQQSVNAGVPEAVVAVGGPAVYHPWAPVIHCLVGGTSWHAARLDPLAREWATDIPGGRAARFAELGLHSAIVVPIRARGVTLGVTTFYRRQREESFDEDDLRLAEEFVARAAVCIDNARRYTRERDAALVLQHSLLPRGTPEQTAVDVASCYRPADELAGVGGDWFDVLPLSGARVALVVGEVVGHGIDAAATMGRLRTAVQTLADLDLTPEELLGHLDDLVGQVSREEGARPGGGARALGTTCLYVVYDPVTRRCRMAGAGHPAPAIVAPDGSVEFPDLPVGPALGIGGLPFESVERTLEEGSVLALYTDGLLAGHRDTGAGRERLRRVLERQILPLDGLCRTAVDSLLPERPPDDVALLMARTRRLGEDQVASWDLPADPAVVARARETAQRQLDAWGLAGLAFTTELVVSELVTNAIRHATGPIRLRLIRDHALICEVSDASNTSPHLRHPRATDEGGRGLFLVAQLTQRWGTRYTPGGKVIWTEQFRSERADGSGWL